MKWDRVFILTFEIGQPDREVLQSAAALYFKHYVKSRNIIWYSCKRPLNYEGFTFIPVCNAPSNGNGSETSTCGIYAISHGTTNNFGGFKCAEEGAHLILEFMKHTGISSLNQLNMVSCGLAHPKGEAYLKTFAETFQKLASPTTHLKLVAWQAFITMFDMRYLAKMLLCGSTKHLDFLHDFRKQIIQILRKFSTPEADTLIKFLDEDCQMLIQTPDSGKSFFKETGKRFSEHLKASLDTNPQVAAELFGKKVGRIAINQNKDFFTKPSEHIPKDMVQLVEKAVQLKMSQTFDWALNVQEEKTVLINNSNQENT